MLLPEQQDDVLKVEQRFAKPDGHGMLLTNGTGTGKTYSGLGVIKRFTKQGKGQILVVAPSQGILADWKRAAKDFGIEAHTLDDTQDRGRPGLNLTTYANLGENQNLVDREWDLVVPDEAQKLSSGQEGDPSKALHTLRALTLHPRGLRDRARMVLKKEWAEVQRLQEAKAPQDQITAAYAAFEAKAKPAIEKWLGTARPKTLMLSATPFSYHFSLDYAEGYLFDYGPDSNSGAYNAPDGRSSFYIQNFGYRMRYGKLTKPDADVRSEIMERQFHEKLKREGALSGRALEVDRDYDRKFIVVDDAIGNKIDQALEFLSSAEDGKYRPLYEVVSKKFDYLSRMRLLEAIKAEHAGDYIRKSLALGRKVVVFHDYNEGGGFNPFDLRFEPNATATISQGGKYVTVKPAELYAEFLAKNPGVKEMDFSSLPPPIQAIKAEFPDALVYNGTVSKKNRELAKAQFNDDGSGKNIIIVQSAAGEAGISLHDITGNKQRALLNLGMPVRPTTAIQEEGRIYRVNQASDALFRYMSTGTNWERWTFAGKIAERAGTAENLALGNQARTMRQAFVDAFDQADTYDPEPGEGTGGKAADRATNDGQITEFEKAKTFYFAQQKTRGRRDQREGADYFATPEPIGLKMVEFADIKPGDKVAEPSAGHGAISRFFPEDTSRTLIEPSSSLASRAALTSPGARVIVDRFENLNAVNKYNAIVMNPPFGHGGATAMAHIAKAMGHLANGGRIVALIPRGGNADKAFDKMMDSNAAEGVYQVGNVLLPASTFERAGTGVSTRIVVLEKQTDPEDLKKLGQSKDRDYSDAESINALFDRIENTDMGQRIKPTVEEVIVEDGKPVTMTINGAELELTGVDGAQTAYLKNKIGAQAFKHLAASATKAGGRWSGSARAFLFGNGEQRQKFIELAGKEPEAEGPERLGVVQFVKFDTGETVHAKTGQNLFVASIADRVDRSVYDQVSAVAKKHGGYYSSFKGRGAIPGFQFKTADARKAFMDDVAGNASPADELDAILGPRASLADMGNSAPVLTPDAQAKRAQIEDMLAKVVERITGKHVTVRFDDTLPITTPGSTDRWGEHGKGVQTAAGMYWPAGRMVELALADPKYPVRSIGTASHEAFHAVEDLLLTDAELRTLEQSEAALRAVVQSYLGWTREKVSTISGEEIRAIAFQAYAVTRASKTPLPGLSGAVRRIFEKIRILLTRLRAGLHGMGFRTAESVFSDVYEGKMAGRTAAPRWLANYKGRAPMPNIESGAFQRWFGDSKVVDAEGKPLVVYHGSKSDFDQFKKGRNKVSGETGFFFTPNPKMASEYGGGDGSSPFDTADGSVYPVYLSVQNPLVVDFEGGKYGRPEAIQRAIAGGHDGVLLKNHYDVGGVSDQWVVFEPTQIKSVNNTGVWNPKNPSIYYSTIGEPSSLADFVRGTVDAEAFAPGDAKWAKVQTVLARFSKPQREAMAKAVETGATATLGPQERAVTERLMKEAGAQPAPVAPAPATPKAPQNKAPARAQAQKAALPPTPRALPPAPAAGTRTAVVRKQGVIAVSPELLADRMMQRNLPKLAKVARKAGINTVETRVKLQDKFLRWKNIQQDVVEATGRPIPEEQDAYLAESLYYGRTGERLEDLDKSLIDPLVADIKARGLTLDDVDAYLYARHAPERNEKIREINPDIADPSGMSDEEAADILKAVDASGKRADYAAIERRVRHLIDESRRVLVDGGLIDQETSDRWAQTYDNYVPLRGWAEGQQAQDDEYSGLGKGFDIRGKESQRALGRTSIADSPLGWALVQAQQAIVRAEKNLVGQAALRFVEANPDDTLWTVDKGGEHTRRVDPQSGLVVDQLDPRWKTKDNVFAVKVNGKPHYIVFKGEYGANLARALKNLGTSNMNGVMRFLGTMTRVLARLATAWNPDFMIPNFIRDMGEAFINLQENEQKGFMKAFAKHLVPAIGGSFTALRGKTGGKYAQAFREFDEDGGRIRFFGMETVDDVKANVESKMRRIEGGAWNNTRTAAEKVVDAIEIANGSIENATRLAAYMAARDVGLSRAKAASIAREMTVNFNRKGEYGANISALYMFANAAMQGITRMAGAMKNKRVRRGAYALAAGGAAMAFYNIGAGGDDDDGTPYYLKIAPWERDNNFIVMWPKGVGHDGKYVKIPLPYGYVMFHVLGSRMSSMVYGDEKASKAVPAMLKSVLDSFDPLGKDENALAQVTPTVGKPLVHLYTNVNWTGRPISPEPQFWNKHQPDSQRTFRTTSEFSQGLAQSLNSMTGGDKHKPGTIDVTPGAIDYMLNFTTGGLGRFAKNTFDTTSRAVQGMEWQPEKTPIVRRFVGEVGAQADRSVYFEEREKVTAAHQRSEAYRKDRDGEGRRRFIADNRAELQAYKWFERVDKQRKNFREESDKIKADKALTGVEREKRLKVLEQRELEQMGIALRHLEESRRRLKEAGEVDGEE